MNRRESLAKGSQGETRLASAAVYLVDRLRWENQPLEARPKYSELEMLSAADKQLPARPKYSELALVADTSHRGRQAPEMVRDQTPGEFRGLARLEDCLRPIHLEE